MVSTGSSTEECQTVTVTATGDAPTADPLSAGSIVTWAFPIYVDRTTEVGEWEGYCVGLGNDADPVGDQICTNIDAIEENGRLFQVKGDEGYITGTSVYDAGESESTILITGGSGSYQDASGAVKVAYGSGAYAHAFTFWF
jgi:hypothetical protein